MDDEALLIATSYSRLCTLQEALDAAGWRADAVQAPREALERLRGRPYAAVFCDDQLVGASAGGFLAWARRVAPGRPFYLFSEAGARLGGQAVAPDGVLSFPPDPAALPRPDTGEGLELDPRGTGEVPLSGSTALIALSDLLEMMCLAGQTARVELDGGRGTLFLDKGVLAHAVARGEDGAVLGLAALAELIQLEADFRVLPYEAPARPSINLPAATAMTEAARLADELARYDRILELVHAHCPQTQAAAVGYGLASAPHRATPGGEAVFEAAKGLLERNRDQLGAPLRELGLAAGSTAWALRLFGEGNLVAARGPASHALHLMQAIRRALRETSDDA